MEWLFLSCHNYWIVCRLVNDDDHPYLAYSPEISIKDSSEPFRAFLGAILSVSKGVPVEASAYSSDMQLDTIEEEIDDGPSPEDDIGYGSGAYSGSSGRAAATGSPMTRNSTLEHNNAESELMVCPLLGRYRLACLSTLRLLRLPPNRMNTPKCGCIYILCRTTRSSFRSAPGAANDAYGLRAL